jgi:Plasmid pRiA4b ORF-3-like protein
MTKKKSNLPWQNLPYHLVYQFKIALAGIEPAIWRQIQVPASYTFWDLHVALQDAMGWLDYHLHEFHFKTPRSQKIIAIGWPNEDADCIPGWQVRVENYFKEVGSSASYLYDFGDGWEHEIMLEGILVRDAALSYPLCTNGAQACPPEDCGGIPGYENLLKVLSEPKSEDYKEMLEWLEGHEKSYFPYKANHFSAAEVVFRDPVQCWKEAYGKAP